MSRVESGRSWAYRNRLTPPVMRGLNAFFDNVVGRNGFRNRYDDLQGVTVDVVNGHALTDAGKRRQMTPPGGDFDPGEDSIADVLDEWAEVRNATRQHIGEELLKKMAELDAKAPNDASELASPELVTV